MDLNPAQEQAVRHRGSPLLIIAGAGSGKTRALTERIVDIVRSGEARPHEILAITFTNKAAREMRERVERGLGPAATGMWLMTFHRASIEILRRDIDRLGYPKNFTVYDTSDQQAVVRLVTREMQLDEKRFPPARTLHAISAAKNEGEGPDDIRARGGFFEDRVAAVMEGYERRLFAQAALDFDDLILKTTELLSRFDDVREKWQRRFRHILVDEYQDTNPAQYRWLRLLAAGGAEVAVVGDPDQSIYGWRGADIRNILEFEKDFPGADIVILDQNYRSTRTILDAANAVVAGKGAGPAKELWTDGGEGQKIVRMDLPDDREEGEAVALEVKDLMGRGLKPSEIAVLFRVNAQSRSLEEAFLRHGIPYRVLAGVRFYEREEVKNVIAYLRLMVNDRDEMAMRRVINVPRRGIGDKTLERLAEGGALKDGRAVGQALSGSARDKVMGFFALLDRLRSEVAGMPLARAVEAVAEGSGILGALRAEGSPEALARIENVDALVARAAEAEEEGDDLESFLGRVALMADADEVDDEAGALTLMTLHAAKGLEFRCVFLVGLEEGLLPHSRALYEERELDEERRLFYVGITRAMEHLYLSHAMRRMLHGQSEPTMPSRFLEEVPDHLARDWAPPVGARRPGITRPTPGRPSQDGIRPGDRVRHASFGEGTVVAARGDGESAEVTVAFDGSGLKTLALRFAGLYRLGA